MAEVVSGLDMDRANFDSNPVKYRMDCIVTTVVPRQQEEFLADFRFGLSRSASVRRAAGS
jgi:hypothetical protein